MKRTGPVTGHRVALLDRRGRFLTAEPFFAAGDAAAIERPRGDAGPGKLALVDFGPRGRAGVVKMLGRPDVAGDVLDALLYDRGLKRGTSRKAEEEAVAAARSVAGSEKGRRDLTGTVTFTIDPTTARDFDDAVSAAPEGDGVRIWVHIADVSAHVRPGSVIDEQARERTTSVYVPGRVEPMLPHALSSDACSLMPGVPRAAVTIEMVVSADGTVGGTSMYRSRIRSDVRMDYDGIDRIFAGKEQPPTLISEPLALARKAARALASRKPSSALEVQGAEPEFEFNEKGHVVGVRRVDQTESHTLIEHLMVATNEQVAGFLERKGAHTLYRVHEQPDPPKVANLISKLAALDLPAPALPKHLSPREAGELVGAASRMVSKEAARRGHGREAYTSLVLRSMKQAVYTHKNLGHAGLGSQAYAHFTSPIRRYPDLIAHRALLAAIDGSEVAPTLDEVRDLGPHCSTREREAMSAEWDADDVCAAFLLKRELIGTGWDAKFEGEVVGVIGAGAFIRFGEQGQAGYEGFLPSRQLGGERFELDETETSIIGGRTGRRIRLGDPVEVRVGRVDAPRGRVDLLPADEPQGRARPNSGKGPETKSQQGSGSKAKKGSGPRGGKSSGPRSKKKSGAKAKKGSAPKGKGRPKR